MKTIENYSSVASRPSIAAAKTKMSGGAPPAVRPGAQVPTVPGDAPAGDVAPEMPKDKWEALELLVSRGARAIEEERKIALIIERRCNIMRRLADGLKRRDDSLVMPTLEDWLKTEVNLADLLVDYAPVQLEREKTLKLIKAQI